MLGYRIYSLEKLVSSHLPVTLLSLNATTQLSQRPSNFHSSSPFSTLLHLLQAGPTILMLLFYSHIRNTFMSRPSILHSI